MNAYQLVLCGEIRQVELRKLTDLLEWNLLIVAIRRISAICVV